MGHERRPDIQGLRALAILYVVLFHAGAVAGGFVGVDVFFAISGFVITTTLVRELEDTGTLSLPAFYGRRVKRLLPGLAVMLGFVAVAGVLLTPEAAVHITALTGFSAAVFGANFYLYSLPHGYFDVSSNLDPLLHTWTLAVEEQFYIVYPLLLLVAWRIGRRVPALIAIGGLTIASFLLAQWWSQLNPHLAFYSSQARAWEFGAGAVTGLLTPLSRRIPHFVASAIGAAGLAAVLAAGEGSAAVEGLAASLLVPVGGACLLMIAGHRENAVSTVLSLRPLTWIGDLSYSWYLWHWPLIVFGRALWPGSGFVTSLAAVGSLVPAWLSYRFVENPIRFRRTLTARTYVRLAAVCIAVPAALFASALDLRLPNASAATYGFHIDYQRGCDDAAPLGYRPLARCSWAADHPRGTVVLIGDSNAGHFSEAVIAADRSLQFDTIVATFSSCAFADGLAVFDNNEREKDCAWFDSGSLTWLLRQRPNLVILGTRADSYIQDPRIALAAPGMPPEHDPAQKARVWAERLHSALARLDRAGVPVILVHPVPELPSFDPGSCAAFLLYIDWGCRGSVSRRAVDARLAQTLAAERAAIAAVRRAGLLDLEDYLCSSTMCSSVYDGLLMYRNQNHLSIPGALALTPIFRRTIESHARRK